MQATNMSKSRVVKYTLYIVYVVSMIAFGYAMINSLGVFWHFAPVVSMSITAYFLGLFTPNE